MSSAVDNLERLEFSLNPRPGFITMLARNTDEKWKLVADRFMSSFRFGKQFETDLPGSGPLIDSVKTLKTKKARQPIGCRAPTSSKRESFR